MEVLGMIGVVDANAVFFEIDDELDGAVGQQSLALVGDVVALVEPEQVYEIRERRRRFVSQVQHVKSECDVQLRVARFPKREGNYAALNNPMMLPSGSANQANCPCGMVMTGVNGFPPRVATLSRYAWTSSTDT